jgi:hypothetical protein
VWGGCVPRFWMQQRTLRGRAVVVRRARSLPVSASSGDGSGREANPAVVQFCKADRLLAGLAQ